MSSAYELYYLWRLETGGKLTLILKISKHLKSLRPLFFKFRRKNIYILLNCNPINVAVFL